jgi:hypothetical protein
VTDRPNPIQRQTVLRGVDYPASRDDLVRHAEQQGADEEVLEGLRQMEDRDHDGPNAVSQSFSR